MDQHRISHPKRALVPVGLTLLRVACVPVVCILLLIDQRTWAIAAFLIVVGTDVLDGYVAHQLELRSSSTVSAYLDSAADFIVIFMMFLVFILIQIYPLWLLLVIVGLYLQFLLTSGRRPRYDPIGKYTGFVFFGIILVTLLFPSPLVFAFAQMVLLGFIALAMVSRLVFLSQSKRPVSG